MCKFASFVLTKDRELWLPGSDSHAEIISHYGIHEDGARGPNVVYDYSNWVLRFDQDVFPDWHDPNTSAERVRAALLSRSAYGFRTVDASGCTALTSLDAKAAKTVYASGCTALKFMAVKGQRIIR